MTEERTVLVEDKPYGVVLSDEKETLLAARAAGRVPVGLWKKNMDFGMVRYLAETLESADDVFLERVVRRELGLPWRIAESERLLLREFAPEDWKKIVPEPQDEEADRIFYEQDKLEAYIQNQYGFYEYGVWAVERKSDNVIVGTAGVTDAEWGKCGIQEEDGRQKEQLSMELGYHIFAPYRRQGYALEACRLILDYVHETFEASMYAVTKRSNLASQKVLERLGFVECKCDVTQEMVTYRELPEDLQPFRQGDC